MTDTFCDFCGRPFSFKQGQPAICMTCGFENVRTDPPRSSVDPKKARSDVPLQETAMRVGALERAVKPRPGPRMPAHVEGRKRRSG